MRRIADSKNEVDEAKREEEPVLQNYPESDDADEYEGGEQGPVGGDKV